MTAQKAPRRRGVRLRQPSTAQQKLKRSGYYWANPPGQPRGLRSDGAECSGPPQNQHRCPGGGRKVAVEDEQLLMEVGEMAKIGRE